MRGCKEDIARIKVDSRGLDSLERQIQELFRLIAKKEGSSNGPQEMSRVQTMIKSAMSRMQEQVDHMHK